MAFEDLKKPELVKEARSLQQRVKILEAELLEMKAKVETEQKEETVKDTPLVAVASFLNEETNKIEVRTINFNLEGDASLDQIEGAAKVFSRSEPHKAFHYVNRIIGQYIDGQVSRKKGE